MGEEGFYIHQNIAAKDDRIRQELLFNGEYMRYFRVEENAEHPDDPIAYQQGFNEYLMSKGITTFEQLKQYHGDSIETKIEEAPIVKNNVRDKETPIIPMRVKNTLNFYEQEFGKNPNHPYLGKTN